MCNSYRLDVGNGGSVSVLGKTRIDLNRPFLTIATLSGIEEPYIRNILVTWLFAFIPLGALAVLALQLSVNVWQRRPNDRLHLTRLAPLRWLAPLFVALTIDITVIYVSVSVLVAMTFTIVQLRKRSGMAEDVLSAERLRITGLVGLLVAIMVAMVFASPHIEAILNQHVWLRAMMVGGFLLTTSQLIFAFWRPTRSLSSHLLADDSSESRAS